MEIILADGESGLGTMARKMASLSVALAFALAIALFVVGRAVAHGKPPEVTQIAMRDGHDALVATSRGLLFGDPSTHRWSLLCSEAFGVRPGGSYRMARLPSGRLFVASVSGVRVGDDDGCTWHPHPALGQRDVTHLFQEADHPARLYVTIFGEDGGIHLSEDSGDTFRALYRAAPAEFLNSVEVARSRPTQLYATLLTTEDLARMFVLRSRDAGATWARTELSGAAEILDVTLLAVNPGDADELLLRVRYIDARNGDGLLHSRDGGQSFTLLGRFGRVSDAVFSNDGTTRLLIASGRVLRASTPGGYVPIEAIDGMTYGGLFDQQLLLSGYRVIDGWLNVMVWSSDVANTSPLQRWMGFDEVTTPKACAAPSPVSEQCASDWADWSAEFLAPSRTPTP
jgi:hypothetical protein